MGKSSEMFLEMRELEAAKEYHPMPADTHKTFVLPNTVKESQKVLSYIREQLKALKEQESKLLTHMEFLGMEFENPDKLPIGIISKMVDGATPYIYAWSLGERLNVKATPFYNGETHLYRNPFFDWDSEEGRMSKVKERRYERENN